MKRFIFGLVLIIFSFTTFWWIPVILSLIGLFYFKNLYEVIFVGFIIDTLYLNQNLFFGFNLMFTIFMLIAFYLIPKFKKQILI